MPLWNIGYVASSMTLNVDALTQRGILYLGEPEDAEER